MSSPVVLSLCCDLLCCACADRRQVNSVTITDIPDVLPHLRYNLDRNSAVLNKHKAFVQVSFPCWTKLSIVFRVLDCCAVVVQFCVIAVPLW